MYAVIKKGVAMQKLLGWLDSPVFKTEKQAKTFLAIFQIATIMLFIVVIITIILRLIELFLG